MQVKRVCACEQSLTLGSLYQYEEVRAISNHSVFGSDFRLQKSNCDFNLRETAGNKSLPLSLSSRGESQLGTVSLPKGANGSHSAGAATCSFTYATCAVMPLPPRVTSPDPSVNKGDGYVETLGSSLLLEVWDEHGKRQHARPSIPLTNCINRC